MDSKEPLTDEAKLAGHWIDEINLAEQSCQDWWRSGDIIIRRYKNDERTGGGNNPSAQTYVRRYAILYANVQTLQPAIYANTPAPIVSRRFRDEDPVAKLASEVLERSLVYSLEAYDFDARLEQVRDDYLLPGRGQVWVRYVPHMREVNVEDDPELGEGEEDEDGGPSGDDPAEPQEEVAYEEVLCDHVDWKDFLTNPCREWREVRWVSRRVLMTRKQLVKRFGEEKGNAIPLDWKPKGYADNANNDEVVKRGQVYEIWDKETRTALWVSKAYTADVLDKRDDPLKLKDFFPCPEPLSATQAPGQFIPIPDYVQYQDQAEELDELTARIGKLQDALRMVGFYAGESKQEMQRVFEGGNENKLVPVDTWAAFKDGGGARGMIEWVPVDMVMQVLTGCYEARSQVISDIYAITGLSDIIRGAGDPNETATAQGIKAQWGSLRVRDRQKDMSRFARDVIRLKAEIIAEHFGIDTLRKMTGVQMPTNEEKQAAQMQMRQQMVVYQGQVQAAQMQGQEPPPPPQPDPKVMEMLEGPSWEDVMGLLKDDALRSFRIEVETDSTIEADETAQKQAFVEFTNAAVGLMTAAAGIVPAAPYTAPLFAEMLKEGARLFRVSRGMEDTIDKVFEEAGAQPPAQPEGPPPPDQSQVQVEQIKGQTAMVQAQNEQARTQMEGQLGAAELQLKQQELQLKAAALQADPTPQGSA